MEGYNRQLRKVTKTKTAFPTDEALLKILYLATIDITKKCFPLFSSSICSVPYSLIFSIVNLLSLQYIFIV